MTRTKDLDSVRTVEILDRDAADIQWLPAGVAFYVKSSQPKATHVLPALRRTETYLQKRLRIVKKLGNTATEAEIADLLAEIQQAIEEAA